MSTALYRFLICMVVAFALSGCHSSKKSVKPPVSGGGSLVLPADSYSSIDDVPWLENDGSLATGVIKEAFGWLGTPYAYGGNTRRGVDCSGLLVNVFRDAAGVKLPRSSAEQQKFCRSLKRNEARPGDLVFFATGKNRNRVGHVGLYIGNDRFIHASSSKGVIVSNLNQKYYTQHYHSAGRISEFARLDEKSGRRHKNVPVPEPATVPDLISEPVVAPDTIHIPVVIEMSETTDTLSVPIPVPEPDSVPQPIEIPQPDIKKEPGVLTSDSIRNEVRKAMRVAF